jgi:hypothetical protein
MRLQNAICAQVSQECSTAKLAPTTPLALNAYQQIMH